MKIDRTSLSRITARSILGNDHGHNLLAYRLPHKNIVHVQIPVESVAELTEDFIRDFFGVLWRRRAYRSHSLNPAFLISDFNHLSDLSSSIKLIMAAIKSAGSNSKAIDRYRIVSNVPTSESLAA